MSQWDGTIHSAKMVESRQATSLQKNAFFKRFAKHLTRWLTSWEMMCLVIGILFGRAMILSNLTPFILPFFATIILLKPQRRFLAIVSLLVGAATFSGWQTLFSLLAIFVYSVLRIAVVRMSKKEEAKLLPYIVLAAGLISRLGFDVLRHGELIPSLELLALVEAGLSYLLCLIFLQSLPLLSAGVRKRSLKNEEIICFIILMASVLSGTIGWTFHGFAVDHILSRYLVLVLAYVGGAAIGSTVGVVVGLILSLANVVGLYQMSLLAFSGLLGGLLKEGKKWGVGLGLIIGTLLIGLYGQGYEQLFGTTMESVIAFVVFLLTPKAVFVKLSSFIPGTKEYQQQQQQYLRKVRDVTANRVEQFSSLFKELSSSFSHQSPTLNDGEEHQVDMFLSQVTEKSCQNCFKKESCWIKNFDHTYHYMNEIMKETQEEPTIQNAKLRREWNHHCIKPDKVVDIIHEQQQNFQEKIRFKKTMQESRKLVADQLMGVSQVMGDFAKEMQKERDTHQHQEEQILYKLQEIGLDVENVDIYNLEEGSVDIDMTIPVDYHGEAEKVIAPILSDILGESIVVKKQVEATIPNGYGQVTFGSAKAYVIETGVAHTAKGGGWISGDNYSTFELGGGKYALAISDGMGNGERAHVESYETLNLLSKVLKSGIDETVAIKSINSILSLRSTDEIFSTLDLVMVDLQNAHAKFLKIGSNPSFLKRGNKVRMIEAGNLPMGIIQDFEVDVVDEELKAGDILVMMSDGILEAPMHIGNTEIWIKRKISEMKTEDPQGIADVLLEEVIRASDGRIEDDMTIVVSRLQHHIPKWSAISTYSEHHGKIPKAQ
ncbi:stage II sporulation protein E [Pullulanibacillus pueri]|uniref:Stage II sporulation protein E n=1 Tax=Pullulanibacillus pueri TaxID=1437324 RepID=A0A8J2ZZ84_9BACL|nr:stage II sporulation protein E [Pullulanibacillus pueri]MBM7683951.1 stage II sporulation protein E [Pullulanibacillus pueri]GGH87990.1 stage II sporulation protein E [Pullulanibacillus pueri]